MGLQRGRSRTKAASKPAAEAPLAGPGESASSLDMEPEDALQEAASSLALDTESEQRVDALREAAGRGGPRGPGSGGKGRSRREREQLTNRPVPAGHERKITHKIRASLAKRRRKQQKTGRARARKPVKAKAAGKPTDENLAL